MAPRTPESLVNTCSHLMESPSGLFGIAMYGKLPVEMACILLESYFFFLSFQSTLTLLGLRCDMSLLLTEWLPIELINFFSCELSEVLLLLGVLNEFHSYNKKMLLPSPSYGIICIIQT